MVSVIMSSVLCIMCVVLVPAVWADYCKSYLDKDNVYQDAQKCAKYCCGSCFDRYCCTVKIERLTQDEQDRCPGSSSNKSQNIGLIVGAVIVSLILIVLCISLIICFVAPCCLCYKKCRKRNNQRQIAVITTVNTPQPVSPTAYQPSYPGYQSVPTYEGPSMPTAPPPLYLESTNPAHSTVVFSQGQPMYSHQSSSGSHAELPHLDELIQPPYNPSYGLNP